MVSNRGVFIFVALLIAFTCGHYKDRPLRYEPLIPHLNKLFHRFCVIRNRNVSRAVTDEEIDLLIRERADRKLLWIYDTFKGEREARMRRYRKRYARWLERMSDEAREIAEAIYRVRNDTSISYSVECKRVNDLKALAPEDVVKELQIRIEDCREFYLVQPQLAKSKCFSGWTQFPIYHGKNYPEGWT